MAIATMTEIERATKFQGVQNASSMPIPSAGKRNIPAPDIGTKMGENNATKTMQKMANFTVRCAGSQRTMSQEAAAPTTRQNVATMAEIATISSMAND